MARVWPTDAFCKSVLLHGDGLAAPFHMQPFSGWTSAWAPHSGFERHHFVDTSRKENAESEWCGGAGRVASLQKTSAEDVCSRHPDAVKVSQQQSALCIRRMVSGFWFLEKGGFSAVGKTILARVSAAQMRRVGRTKFGVEVVAERDRVHREQPQVGNDVMSAALRVDVLDALEIGTDTLGGRKRHHPALCRVGDREHARVVDDAAQQQLKRLLGGVMACGYRFGPISAALSSCCGQQAAFKSTLAAAIK